MHNSKIFVSSIALTFYITTSAAVVRLSFHKHITFSILNDSIRSENIAGRRVIVYRVGEKETFYSISRKYSLKPDALIGFNNENSGSAGKSLHVGDEIFIPRELTKQLTSSKSTASEGLRTHTVAKGETLYSISRLYGISVDLLVKTNSITGGLSVGKVLQVPAGDKTQPIMPATGLYTVQQNETLYSISTRYGLATSKLRELNGLKSDEINAGQILKLKDDSGAPTSISTVNTAPSSTSTPVPTANKTPASSVPAAKRIPVHKTEPPTDTPARVAPKPEIIYTPEKDEPKNGHVAKEYKEEGMGKWLDNTDLNQARSVALHRSAPVGTVMKVTNPSTKKSIFVKVVGNFQQNADNRNAVVVISKTAAELIGAVNPTFRVELSYAY